LQTLIIVLQSTLQAVEKEVLGNGDELYTLGGLPTNNKQKKEKRILI
jgi:hypothetical protein